MMESVCSVLWEIAHPLFPVIHCVLSVSLFMVHVSLAEYVPSPGFRITKDDKVVSRTDDIYQSMILATFISELFVGLVLLLLKAAWQKGNDGHLPQFGLTFTRLEQVNGTLERGHSKWIYKLLIGILVGCLFVGTAMLITKGLDYFGLVGNGLVLFLWICYHLGGIYVVNDYKCGLIPSKK